MQNNEIKKIIIAGGGTAGWLAAALFSTHIPKERLEIVLIESDEIGTIGVGESTIPPFLGLLRNLGINEQDFIKKCHASFKLGIKFDDWHKIGESYFHPFGQIGANIGNTDFYNAWLYATQNGLDIPLQDFSPSSVMARENRFMLPIMAQGSPINNAAFALHLDAKLAAKYLRTHSESQGVKRIEGLIERVEKHENGFIKSVTTKRGEVLDADFFVDCTGFRALLIGDSLGVGYISWENELLCNRAIAVQTENTDIPDAYTTSAAQDFGWRWRIPLQSRSGNGYVFSSQFISDDEATAKLLSQVQGKPITDPMVVPFQSGMRKEIWSKNVLSLGLASGFIEPLESTAIHLVYRTLDFFFRYFPDKNCDAVLANDFNRRIANDYIEIKDFIVAHYCLTEREDTEFWRWCKNQTITQDLRNKIEVFKKSSALRETGPEELFRAPSWYSIFEGMGVRPKRYNFLADALELEELVQFLGKIKPELDNYVRKLPTLKQFIDENCKAQ